MGWDLNPFCVVKYTKIILMVFYFIVIVCQICCLLNKFQGANSYANVDKIYYILIINEKVLLLLHSKLRCFLARKWPRDRVSITSGSLYIGLPKSRAPHSPRDVISPGLLLSGSEEVATSAPRIPCAGPRSVSLLTIVRNLLTIYIL